MSASGNTIPRMRGKIRRINYEKRYGFIRVPGHPDHFFHISGLTTRVAWDDLQEETECEFTPEPPPEGKTGPRAANVVLL